MRYLRILSGGGGSSHDDDDGGDDEMRGMMRELVPQYPEFQKAFLAISLWVVGWQPPCKLTIIGLDPVH